jgi:hypothetical protein
MTFTSVKLKPESGANRIKSADDAYSFMMHMRLSDQNKPQASRMSRSEAIRRLVEIGLKAKK